MSLCENHKENLVSSKPVTGRKYRETRAKIVKIIEEKLGGEIIEKVHIEDEILYGNPRMVITLESSNPQKLFGKKGTTQKRIQEELEKALEEKMVLNIKKIQNLKQEDIITLSSWSKQKLKFEKTKPNVKSSPILRESTLIKPTRAGVYIDAPNIVMPRRTLGWEFNYKALAEFLRERYELIHPKYYDCQSYKKDESGLVIDESGLPVVSYRHKKDLDGITSSMKFEKVTKLPKVLKNGNYKNNMDSAIAYDIGVEKRLWDVLVLFSGDGDFYYPIEKLLQLGKNVHIYSFRSSLGREFEKFIEIGKIQFYDLEEISKIKGMRRSNVSQKHGKRHWDRYHPKNLPQVWESEY